MTESISFAMKVDVSWRTLLLLTICCERQLEKCRKTHDLNVLQLLPTEIKTKKRMKNAKNICKKRLPIFGKVYYTRLVKRYCSQVICL